MESNPIGIGGYKELIMSISGVSAWWARNILGDAPKVRLFATIGTLSAIFLVWSTW